MEYRPNQGASPRLHQQPQQQVRPPPPRMQQQQLRPPQPQSHGPPRVRLAELLDAVRQEAGMYKAQRDEYEAKLQMQLKEQASMQASLQDLVNVSNKIKAQYEDELIRMRREMESALKSRPADQDPAPASANRPPPVLKRTSPVAQALQLDNSSSHQPPKRLKTEDSNSIVGLADAAVPEKYVQKYKDVKVVYNPEVTALTDGRVTVDLVHTLEHDRCRIIVNELVSSAA